MCIVYRTQLTVQQYSRGDTTGTLVVVLLELLVYAYYEVRSIGKGDVNWFSTGTRDD